MNSASQGMAMTFLLVLFCLVYCYIRGHGGLASLMLAPSPSSTGPCSVDTALPIPGPFALDMEKDCMITRSSHVSSKKPTASFLFLLFDL